MAIDAPPTETVPKPGIWTDDPANLTGGFLLNYAKSMDRRFPFPIFERLVQFVWKLNRRSNNELPLVVKNCGWVLNVMGIDFYRMPDGTYLNFEDPIRMTTGAAMYYRLKPEGRSTIVGDSTLMAPSPLDIARMDLHLTLVKGEEDHWLRMCGEVPECGDLDGTCG